MGLLPKEKIKSTIKNPKRLIMFGKPKVGKTSLLAELDNCLILDFEKGSDYVDALKIQVDCLTSAEKKIPSQVSMEDIVIEIVKEKKPYKYLAIDTATAFENMCLKDALAMYKATPIGKNFKGDDILLLPNGAGYWWLRKAFFKWIKICDKLADNVILVGHIKDKYVNDNGKEVVINALDLTGKIGPIMASMSDAIGYVYRNKEKETIMSFGDTQSEVGSRCAHLKGKDIVLAKEDEEGNFTTFWNKVYIKE